MVELTKGQQEVLDVISTKYNNYGYLTLTDVLRKTRLSRSTIRIAVLRLMDYGLIKEFKEEYRSKRYYHVDNEPMVKKYLDRANKYTLTSIE